MFNDPAAKLVALMQAPKISSIEYPETILYRGPEHRALQEQLFTKLAGGLGTPEAPPATGPVAAPVPPVSAVPSQRGVKQGTAESVQDKVLNKVMPRKV